MAEMEYTTIPAHSYTGQFTSTASGGSAETLLSKLPAWMSAAIGTKQVLEVSIKPAAVNHDVRAVAAGNSGWVVDAGETKRLGMNALTENYIISTGAADTVYITVETAL